MPKYRFKILKGEIGSKVEHCIRAFSEQSGAEVKELSVQIDHVHLLPMIPPKISVSDYVGIVKGRTAIRIFNHFKKLKAKILNTYIAKSFDKIKSKLFAV